MTNISWVIDGRQVCAHHLECSPCTHAPVPVAVQAYCCCRCHPCCTSQIEHQFHFRTAVLNDFEAVGYGIPALAAEDLVVLNDAPVVPHAPKVVMG